MRNFIFLFIVCTLLTTFSACKEETLTLSCSICGLYSGTISGDLEIPLTGTDTSFLGIPSTVQFSENQTTIDYIVVLDISSLTGLASGSSELEMNGFLTGNTLTIPNQSYQYGGGINNLLMSGTMDFSVANATTASFTFTDDAVGTINFVGTK